MNEISAFHTRLRHALDRRGISQTELARQLEVRVATVNEWLNRGTMPSGPIMLRLPGVLAVDGHWLLTGENRTSAGESVAPEIRKRVSELLAEALGVLESSSLGAPAPAEVARVRKPREDETLALEAVERHRRMREGPTKRRKSG